MTTWTVFYVKLLCLAFALFLLSLGNACIANQCVTSQVTLSGILLPHWSDLTLTFLVFSAGTMSPGPSSLMILVTALTLGRHHAISFSVGVVVGQFIWSILVASSLLVIVTDSESLFSVLKLLISCYLIYMACKSFQSCILNKSVLDRKGLTISSPLATFYKGLAITLANAQVGMTWLATYSISMDVSAGVIFFAMICIPGTLIASIIYVGYAVLFSTPKVSSTYKTMHRRHLPSRKTHPVINALAVTRQLAISSIGLMIHCPIVKK